MRRSTGGVPSPTWPVTVVGVGMLVVALVVAAYSAQWFVLVASAWLVLAVAWSFGSRSARR